MLPASVAMLRSWPEAASARASGSTHDVSLDELSHVGVVPRGLLALASQAGLAGVIGAVEVEGDPAQAGQVARGPALADAAVVLAEDDVQDPVQAVLDPPVVPDG